MNFDGAHIGLYIALVVNVAAALWNLWCVQLNRRLHKELRARMTDLEAAMTAVVTLHTSLVKQAEQSDEQTPSAPPSVH